MTLPKNFIIGLLVFLFFFNRVGLPFGISFDMLLTPFLLFYIFTEKALIYVYKTIGVLLVFGVIHFFSGVYFKEFVVSNLVFITLVIGVVSFYLRAKSIDFFD